MSVVLSALWRRLEAPLARRRHVAALRTAIRASGNVLRIVVGASGTARPGWVGTDYPLVDLTDPCSLQRVFVRESVSAILAEHVWEHLTEEQALAAARNCYQLLRPGGYLRIAVPDGLHPDPAYIEYVRPGGTGAGSDDHKVLYTHASLAHLLKRAGFRVEKLEWFDEEGKFHYREWSPEDGYIARSTRFDERNALNPTAYTSLILDAHKPLEADTAFHGA